MTAEGSVARDLDVPVALFVYRRHQQLPRTLECLRRSGAGKLYVFSDGPAAPAVAEDVEAVRALLRAVDWTETVIVERPQNIGLSASIRAGLDSVFAEHARAIVIEDDVCVAPEFCAFARAALEHYEGEERVAGVTGLRYPFARAPLDRYPFDVFMSPRFSSWGWATWRDRWRAFSFDHDELRRELAARCDVHPERAGADMPWLIREAVVEESLGGSWDVDCAANMLLRGQYFVTAAWNMVENSGQLEGTHGSERAPKWTLAWEGEHAPADGAPARFAPVAEDEHILEAYRAFFAPGPRQVLAASLARLRSALRR
jgi:hypothetical protein